VWLRPFKETPEHDPEQPIHRIQFRMLSFALQHRYPLAKSENLQRQIGSAYEEDTCDG